ncbi:stalk domain-containing protein [Paenibacillus sp. NEAU-GSW1]|uniref:stalk domain-containing protein n=1 Tax=Paenibacillus sp. NEAU-GSW1 TaxID=2682486 RepID=UPI0020A6257F|nr:stalk domain-containing protein [Paenibacillus sp. NEAU-GSW1]
MFKNSVLLSTVIAGSLLIAPLSGGAAHAASAQPASVASAAKLAVTATSTKSISVYLNDEKLQLSSPPFVKDGVTFVPMRSIFTALGASVYWESKSQTIVGSKPGVTVTLTVGSKTAVINGKASKLEAAPIVKSGVTYVPARFVAESLDATVNWDARTNSVRIMTQAYEQQKEAEAQRAKLTTTQIVDKYDDSVVLISTNRAMGSGVVIGDRWILTNHHVIVDAASATVLTVDGDNFEVAGVAAYDEDYDLAIIQTKESLGVAPVELGYADLTSKKGDKVVAIGSPLGLQNTVSDGLISNIVYEGGVRYIQTSAPIDHGSSGGALFNEYGELIGITTAGYTSQADLNFAVAVTYGRLLYAGLPAKPAANVKFLESPLPKTLVGASNERIQEVIADNFSYLQTSEGLVEFSDWNVTRDAEGWLVISATIDPSAYLLYGGTIEADLRAWALNLGYELSEMLPDEPVQLLINFDREYSFKPRGFTEDEVHATEDGKWRLFFPVINLQVKDKAIITVRA